MDELSDKIKRELQEILDPPGVRAKRQLDHMGKILLGADATPSKENYEKMAVRYAQSLDGMPMCFWIKLFSVAEDITNPILHTRGCEQYDAGKEVCLAGHPMDECQHDCPDYEGAKEDYSKCLECNGDCANHTGPSRDGAGGSHA
jgi:hypothetical protein